MLKVRRSYRNKSPGTFYRINLRVYKSLKDTSKFPEKIILEHPELFRMYFETSEKHDVAYHESTYGHKLAISQRDVLAQQLILYLDEIALIVEAAALHNIDILVCSGFDLGKERRSSNRTNTSTAVESATEQQHEQQQS